jgi:hypothetical protein
MMNIAHRKFLKPKKMVEVVFQAPPLGNPGNCRVFVPNLIRSFDISDLKRFGCWVIPICDWRAEFPDEVDQAEKSLIRHIFNFLTAEGFNPLRDYVALMGDPILNAATFLVLGQIVDEVCLLRYDTQARAYWPIMLKL